MTSRNTESLVLLVRAKNQAGAALRGVDRDLKNVGKSTTGFQKTAIGVGKFASKAFIGVGVAAAGMAVVSIKAFGDFEDKLNQSLAIMGNVAPALRNEMSDTARAISRETRIGANDAAESYFFLASAGLNAEQSIAALPQVAAFAQAGMFDMARATDLATDAQSALGLTVDNSQENLKNLTRVTDVLVKANTLANASVEQFSTSLTNKAGAALKVVNKDIEEGVAVLAAFADQGIKGEQAGTALNIIMRDLQTQSIKNRETFSDFNVEVFDSSGKMNNLGEIIGDLEGALAGMSDEQKKATLAQLGFNDKSVIFLQTLLGTSEQIGVYEEKLREAGGTTQEVADKQLESINAQFDILGNKTKDMVIGLGEDLAPTVKDELIPALEGLIDSTAIFVETIGPPLITAVQKGVDAMIALETVALGIIGIWDEEARKKEQLLLLTSQLNKGMGEEMDTTTRLTASWITLAKQNAWTEQGLESLINTTGATTQEVLEAREATLAYAEAKGYDIEFIKMLRAATSDATQEVRDSVLAKKEGIESSEDHVDQINIEEDAFAELEDQVEDTLSAQQEYTDELKAMTDPVFGAVRSLGKMRDAQAEVDELIEEGKEGTDEYAQAMLDLAEATIGAQDSLDDVDPTTLNKSIDDIALAMGSSREATIEFLDQLGLLDGKQLEVLLNVKAPIIKYTQHGNAYEPAVGGLLALARGGGFMAGDLLLVGEDGPEFMMAGTSGTVISNPNTPGGNFSDFIGGGSTVSNDELASLLREIADRPTLRVEGGINPRSEASAEQIADAMDYKIRTSVRTR